MLSRYCFLGCVEGFLDKGFCYNEYEFFGFFIFFALLLTCFMKFDFKRWLPKPEQFEKKWMLRPFVHLLKNPLIWHLNRRSVAAGIAIGLFLGSLPIFGQIPLAMVMALAFRAHMPSAVMATLISNPVTMPFLFTANYYVGTWLLKQPCVVLSDIQWSLDGLIHLGGEVLVPLYLGSIVVGLFLAGFSFSLLRLIWRLRVVQSHRERRLLRIKQR